jgi:hypothetical protein
MFFIESRCDPSIKDIMADEEVDDAPLFEPKQYLLRIS